MGGSYIHTSLSYHRKVQYFTVLVGYNSTFLFLFLVAAWASLHRSFSWLQFPIEWLMVTFSFFLFKFPCLVCCFFLNLLNVPIWNHFDVPQASFDVTPIEMALFHRENTGSNFWIYINTGPNGIPMGSPNNPWLPWTNGFKGDSKTIIFRHFQNLDWALEEPWWLHYSSVMKNHDLVGTWILFSIQLGISSSQLTFTHIFQRGCFTTNHLLLPLINHIITIIITIY